LVRGQKVLVIFGIHEQLLLHYLIAQELLVMPTPFMAYGHMKQLFFLVGVNCSL
jgi:hypothetical protein